MSTVAPVNSKTTFDICACLNEIGKGLSECLQKIKDVFWRVIYWVRPSLKPVPETKITLHTNLQLEQGIENVLMLQPANVPSLQYMKQVLIKAREPEKTPEEHHTKLKTAQREIGQVLYLTDVQPKPIDHTDPQVKTQIKEAFETNLASVRKKLSDIAEIQFKAGLQDPKMTLQTATPKEIGIALVTSNGHINIGIIHDLKSLASNRDLLDYEKAIVRGLDVLENVPALQRSFDLIVKPKDPKHPINLVIRAILGLAPEEEITDVHAKRVAMIALLSHLRQGPTGSCFATYLGVGLLNQRLDKCLRDFTELLATGKLTRTIDGKGKDFDFLMRIADEDLSKKFLIDPSGNLAGKNIPIYEVPGIKSALRQMEFIDPVAATKRAMAKLNPNGVTECTVERLISLYSDNQDLVDRGLFAFSCETNNGLLRVWENLFADMAGADPNGYVNARIVNCVIDALVDFFPKKTSQKGFHPVEGVREVLKVNLKDQIRLVYDSTIANGDGGYTLEHVSNPEDFKAFVVKALNRVQGANVDKIVDYVKTDSAFLKGVLWAFDGDNKQFDDPVASLQKLKSLPWKFETGNNLRKTYIAEMGKPMPTPILAHPKNGLDLAAKFLQTCTRLSKTTDIYKANQEEIMIPVQVPSHAFNAYAKSPKIVEFLKSGKLPEVWLRDNLVNPGLDVSRMQIAIPFREGVVKYVIDNNMIPQDKVAQFHDEVKPLLAGQHLMIQSFAQQLMKIISKLNQGGDLKRQRELSQLFGAYLLDKGLPEAARNKLYDAALLIANLSWNENVEDVEFQVMFDVVSGSPVLVGASTGHRKFIFADEEVWVNVRWDFFPTDYK